jgi:hypothetical protein
VKALGAASGGLLLSLAPAFLAAEAPKLGVGAN